ncbi:MAG: cell division protein FtsA [Fimbriimonadaceae bacterium]|nr:cell division protein FtsA [Fimbriimonadaceae bacterium]
MRSGRVHILDLGSTKAVCLAAELTETGRIKVESWHSTDCKGVRKAVVTDLEEAAKAVDKVCRAVESDTNESIESLVVGIGGAHVEGINSQGFVPIYPRTRPITRDDVLQVVNHSRQISLPPDREQIQAIPREFRIDGQRGIKKPIGMSGGRLEVNTYLVSGQATHIQNLERVVEMSGRKIERLVPKALASGLAVLTDEQRDLGAAVIDIGGGSTEIAVFFGESVAFSASVPIGGQLVTSDISKLLKASPEEAERLKLEGGLSWAKMANEDEIVGVLQLGQIHKRDLQRRVLAEIIESRMRELARMSRQQIEKSGFFGMLPGGIVLTGGASLIPGTAELFQSVFQHMKVSSQEPHLSGQREKGLNRPELATAVGLSTFGLECQHDEFAPATVDGSWKDKIRTFLSLMGGKA